jgi:hypothetical protein
MDEENSGTILKRLEDVTNHLAHLQQRVDALQGCMDALYPYVLESQVRLKYPTATDEQFKARYAYALDLYLRHRDEGIAKYSEFPFLTGEPPPNIPPPTSPPPPTPDL